MHLSKQLLHGLRRQIRVASYVTYTSIGRSSPLQTTSYNSANISSRKMPVALELAIEKKSRDSYQYLGQLALMVGTSLGASFMVSNAECSTSNDKKGDSFDLMKALEDAKNFVNGLSIPTSVDEVQNQINAFLASGKGGQVSWGFMMGACTGFAMKKISKVGAVALGSVFILMQCASYSGYIDVNYKKLERDITSYLDLNKDGKIDTEDVEVLRKRVMEVMEFSLPAGSGFGVGFVLGFRSG